MLLDSNLSAKFVVELFNGVQLSIELFRMINLFLLDDLSPSLDDILHLALRFTHHLIEFLQSTCLQRTSIVLVTIIDKQLMSRAEHHQLRLQKTVCPVWHLDSN